MICHHSQQNRNIDYKRRLLCGNDEADYNIADMIIWAWYGQLVLGKLYDAAEFLQVQDYKHIQRWAKKIAERPAVKRAIDLELKPID